MAARISEISFTKNPERLLYSISYKAAILEKTMEKFLEIWEQFYDLFNDI